ncbi:MAG: aminopeptidase [Bacillota bacterium]
MNEKMLILYARLVLLRGLALKEHEELVINAPITAASFVRILTREAYKTFKSGTVHVNYTDPYLSKIAYQYAHDDVLTDVPEHLLYRLKELISRKAAFLTVSSSFPDLMKGIDQARVQKAQKAMGPKTHPFQQKIIRTLKWSVAPFPNYEWAKKVYPNMETSDALIQLHEDIANIMRLNEETPIKVWTEHLNRLEKKRQALNAYRFKKLIYKGGGTDLEVELPKTHRWVSGAQKRGEEVFVPNMPTEEIFTAPKKDGVNGTLVVTKPMSVRGITIEPFTLTFKDGKVDQVESSDQATLDKIFSVDEGAKFLGEVALVEENSPVAKQETLYYHTLLDENSSCHFAFGNAYLRAVKNESKEKDINKLVKTHGINRSHVHIDFMVGSEKLAITGVKEDGEEVPIMRGGMFTETFTDL